LASPALLFEILSKSKLSTILGAPLFVAAVGSLATAVAFFLVVKVTLKRTASESLMGAMSASCANWGNLGIPIATFVLGDSGYVAPLVIFQIAFFTPLMLAGLDATSGKHRTTPLGTLLRIVRNPIIVGSGLGLLAASTGITVPAPVMEPIHLIGGAAVPAMLIAFGMSLNGSVPLQASNHRRLDTLLAISFKLIVHPLLAYAFGRFILQLEPAAVFATVIMAAMPTAQNVFVVAGQYQTGFASAKDTVLLTTVIALPVMAAVALVLT
jgi:predicted permease